MPKCVLCKSVLKKGSNISFHRFPTDKVLKSKWIENIKPFMNLEPKHNDFLCSKHFHKNCINKLPNLTFLKSNSVPTIFDVPFQSPKSSGTTSDARQDISVDDGEQVSIESRIETDVSIPERNYANSQLEMKDIKSHHRLHSSKKTIFKIPDTYMVKDVVQGSSKTPKATEKRFRKSETELKRNGKSQDMKACNTQDHESQSIYQDDDQTHNKNEDNATIHMAALAKTPVVAETHRIVSNPPPLIFIHQASINHDHLYEKSSKTAIVDDQRLKHSLIEAQGRIRMLSQQVKRLKSTVGSLKNKVRELKSNKNDR